MLQQTNSSIYEKNVQALEKRNIVLPEDVAEQDVTFVVEPSKNGQITIRGEKDGKQKYIHSKFNPQKEAEQLISNTQLTRSNVVVCFGLGFAYHVEALINKLGDYNKIVIIEPSLTIFYELLRHRDISLMLENNNVHISFSEDKEHIKSTLASVVEWDKIEDIQILVLPAYTDLFYQAFQNFQSSTKTFINEAVVNRNTLLHYGELWQGLFFHTLNHFMNGYYLYNFINVFENVPIVLVSAGPSLNKNVHLLKEIKGKCPIVCVYTAYKVLQKLGIEPDFLVSLDSKQLINETEEERKRPIYPPLLCVSSTDKRLLDKHKGKKIFFSTGIDIASVAMLHDLGKPIVSTRAGGSVACAALDLCVAMGGNPVVLIGQDLAFTGKKTHAEGTYYDGKSTLSDTDKYVTVDGIDGEPILTDRVFLSFKTWFDQYVTDHCEKITFIDATEGGAKIDNTVIMPFAQAIEKYLHQFVDVNQRIEEAFAKGPMLNEDDKKKLVDNLLHLQKDFSELAEELQQIENNCKKIIKLYEKNEKLTKANTIAKILAKLDAFDKKLKKRATSVANINLMFQIALYQIQNFDREQKLSEEVYIMTKNLMAYQGLRLSIKEVKPKLDEAILALESIK